MITTGELAGWLRANGLPAEAAITVDGDIPVAPDRVVVLTRTGGQGAIRERTFDRGVIQVITRDGQRSFEAAQAAESLADLVDDLLMGIPAAIEIGGKRVSSVDREGAPPSFLDRDEAQRVLYVASYVFEVGRSVF